MPSQKPLVGRFGRVLPRIRVLPYPKILDVTNQEGFNVINKRKKVMRDWRIKSRKVPSFTYPHITDPNLHVMNIHKINLLTQGPCDQPRV